MPRDERDDTVQLKAFKMVCRAIAASIPFASSAGSLSLELEIEQELQSIHFLVQALRVDLEALKPGQGINPLQDPQFLHLIRRVVDKTLLERRTETIASFAHILTRAVDHGDLYSRFMQTHVLELVDRFHPAHVHLLKHIVEHNGITGSRLFHDFELHEDIRPDVLLAVVNDLVSAGIIARMPLPGSQIQDWCSSPDQYLDPWRLSTYAPVPLAFDFLQYITPITPEIRHDPERP